MHDALPRRRSAFSALGVCLSAAGLTLLLLGVVYALRGIWPFGAQNVSRMDSTQFYLPDFYALWDAMHGAKAVGLNWYAGLAESGSTNWASLLRNDIDWICFLNPANWVFRFVARDHILEAMSLYLAVYMVMISLVTAAVLQVRFPRLAAGWQIGLALLYTFSGFVLQYHFIYGYLPAVLSFPPLLYGLERLLRTGKYIPYTVVYTLLLCLNVYFAFLSTIYILLFACGYSFLLLPREERGDRILRLGLATAAAFGLGAYFWTDNLASFTGASRFDSNLSTGLIEGLSTWNITYTAGTTLMLFGTAVLTAVFLRRRRNADRKAALFFGLLLSVFLLPMVFTNIDTAWHFGQYNYFPMRYGYMQPATMIAAAAALLQKDAPVGPTGGSLPRWVSAAGAIAAAAALAFLMPRLCRWLHDYGSYFLPTVGAHDYWLRYFVLYLGCGLLFVCLYLCLFRLPHRLGAPLIAAALLLQLGANAFGLIAADDSRGQEYNPSYVHVSDALYAYFSERDASLLSRVKNVDNSLNAAYPVIAHAPALSSANSLNASDRLAVFDALGYTTHYFRILDTGGTVFTDMLFGVDTILSAEPLDDALYADTGDTVGGIHIGRSLYPGLVGLTFDPGALDDVTSLPTLRDRLNALYRAFTGSDDTLAFTPAHTLEADGIACTLTCTLDAPSLLYLRADCALVNITAEGRTVGVPTYGNTGNTTYPATYNHNVLCLGSFDAGDVTIRFTAPMTPSEDAIEITALYTAPLESFRANARYDENILIEAGGDQVVLTLTSDRADAQLFLPMTFSERWQCTVNGVSARISPALGTLMSVPLDEGENVVCLRYVHPVFRLNAAIAVSLVCLAAVIAWLALRRRPALATISVSHVLQRIALWLFAAVCAALVLYIYVAPMILLMLRGSIVRI